MGLFDDLPDAKPGGSAGLFDDLPAAKPGMFDDLPSVPVRRLSRYAPIGPSLASARVAPVEIQPRAPSIPAESEVAAEVLRSPADIAREATKKWGERQRNKLAIEEQSMSAEKLPVLVESVRTQAGAQIHQAMAGILDALGADEGAERARELGKERQAESDILMQQIGQGSGAELTRQLGSTSLSSLPATLAAPAGLMGIAAVAGAQSFGSNYEQARESYIAQGVPKELAEDKAYLPAALSGIITFGLTRAMSGGMEQLAVDVVSGKMSRDAAANLIGKVLVESVHEIPEEFADQLGQGIVAKLTYDPDKTPGDIVGEAINAGVQGALGAGIIGAGGATVAGGGKVVRGVVNAAGSMARGVAAHGAARQLDKAFAEGELPPPAEPTPIVQSVTPPTRPGVAVAPRAPREAVIPPPAETIPAKPTGIPIPETRVPEKPTAIPTPTTSGSASTGGTTIHAADFEQELTKPAAKVETHLPENQFAVVDAPMARITLSAEVPNFKEGADESGVVEPLGGKKYERLGTAPIVLWERADGRLEVITGRHRFDLAKRTGEATIPAQIVKESDGWDQQRAMVLDAEINIRDGQGAVSDYAQYFKNHANLTRDEAESRGLLARAKGAAGWHLGRDASPDLYALYRASKIGENAAIAIAAAAPGNPNVQQIGIKAAADGARVGEIVGRMEAAQASAVASGKADQFDFFADTSLEEVWKKQGEFVADKRRALQDIVSTRRPIVKKGEAATGTGSIKTKQKKVIQELAEAEAEIERWKNWFKDPALKAEVDAAVAGKPAAKQPDKNAIVLPKEPVIEPEKPKADTGTGDMFGGTVEQKSPEQLAEEKRKKDQAAAIAAGQGKKLTGAVDTTMILPGTEEAAGEGDIPLLTQPKKPGAVPTPPTSPSKEGSSPSNAYGSDNKLISAEQYEKLKAEMRRKLGGNLYLGIDPELITMGAQMALYHIEAGARSFADYAERMIADLGDGIRPYLRSLYDAARSLPGNDFEDQMTPPDETRRLHKERYAKAVPVSEPAPKPADAGAAPKPAKPAQGSPAARGDNGPGPGQADAGPTRGSGGIRRPAAAPELRVARPELLPTPRPAVSAGTYAQRGFLLDEHQLQGINLALQRFEDNGKGFMLADGTGFGKAQPLDAKILTPDGWKRMGDIKVGQHVIGANGKPTMVTAVFPQGEKTVFKVTFSDGSSTECCNEHLWFTTTWSDRRNAARGLKRPGSVKPLSEIAVTLKARGGQLEHKIPVVDPVEFSPKVVPLHPYLLGALIGDGSLSKAGQIKFSCADRQMIQEIVPMLPEGVLLNHEYGCDYRLAFKDRKRGKNPVINAINSLGLRGKDSASKFIPASYLINSSEVRQSLLHGLMDTDGTIGKAGFTPTFTTVSKQLSQDMVFLVQSLGGTARVYTRHTNYTYKDQKKVGQLSYTVAMTLPSGVTPFRCDRKRKLVKPPTKYPPRRYIKKVEKVGLKECQCIRVESADHLYVTDDFVVTHNTAQILAIADQFKKRTKKPVLIVTQNRQIIGGSFTKDAKAMGIDLKNFEIGTYDDVRTGKIGKEQYGLVLYDEAHNLKNAGAKKSEAAGAIKSDHVVFATATPLDRPSGASYLLSAILDIDEATMQAELGFKQVERKQPNGDTKIFLVLDEGASWAKVLENIVRIRDTAIKAGAFVRREYPFWGEVKNEKYSMPFEARRQQEMIDEWWQEQIDAAASPNYRRNLAGQRILELSRWTEQLKSDDVYNAATKALAEGKAVVIIAEGINDTVVKGLGGEEVPGLITLLDKRFAADGIETAKIYGDNDKAAEVEKFQSRRARVTIATPKSGGTGINLDDTVGDRPVKMIISTANFSGDVFDQILGRISRKTTQSPSEIEFHLYGDAISDGRRQEILEKKVAALRAIQGGTDTDVATFDTEGENIEQEKPKFQGSAPIGRDWVIPEGGKEVPQMSMGDFIMSKLKWQPVTMKSGRRRVAAEPDKAFWDWYRKGGKSELGKSGASVAKINGVWFVLSDSIPGAQKSLATLPPQDLGRETLVATGPEEVLKMLDHPEASIPTRVKQVIRAMLETPVMRNLDWNTLKVLLMDRIDGATQGESLVEQNLIGLIRQADADVFPHEVFHFLYEMLPARDKQVVDQLRMEALEKALAREDLTAPERAFLESLQDGEFRPSASFDPKSIRIDLYQFINPSEFLAMMAGEKFATDVWNGRNNGFLKSFVEKIKGWVTGILDSLKRTVGIRPSIEQVYRELLAGKHTNRMTAAVDEVFSVQASFSKNAAEARNAAAVAATAEQKEVEAAHQLAQAHDITELLEKHGAGTATPRAHRMLGYLDYAGIREVGRRLNGGVLEGYQLLKARIADDFRNTWMARIANTQFEGFIRKVKDVQQEQAKMLKKITGKAFLQKMVREQVAKSAADTSDMLVRVTASIFESAHRKAQKAMDYEKNSDIEIARLEGQLKQIDEASKSSTAMQQLLRDMVSVLYSTPEGVKLLTDPAYGNRGMLLAEYKTLKSAVSQPLHNETLLLWAAYILKKSPQVAEALFSQHLIAQAPIRALMNSFETKFMADLEADPIKAIKDAIRQRVDMSIDRERAMVAWRTLHAELMEELKQYAALSEAAAIGSAVLADPDFIALRNEIARDARMLGNIDPAKPFTANTIMLPDGSEFEIDPTRMVGSKTLFTRERSRYEAAIKTFDAWLQDPANADHPNRGMHERNFLELRDYFYGLAMLQPSDPIRLWKRTFDIARNAVSVAGGRVAAQVRTAMARLDIYGRKAAWWTQKHTNELAILEQLAIKSHDIEYSSYGDTSVHDAAHIWYRNIGNELFYSHNRQANPLATGDVTGSGWKVTAEDMRFLRHVSAAISEGFDIAGESQVTKDTLGGFTLFRKALKGTEHMTVRTFSDELLDFAREYDAAKDEKERLALLDRNFHRLGYAFVSDRNAEFAQQTIFDGDGGAFSVVAERMRNDVTAIPDTDTLFTELSSLSAATPDEAKAIVLSEWGRIIHNYVVERGEDAPAGAPRAEETKNAFTRSRNEAVGPYVLYENGFRNSHSVQRFGVGIISRQLDDVVNGMEAQKKDIERQEREFQTKVELEMSAGKAPKAAQKTVRNRAAIERANGENYDHYENLQWRKKVLQDAITLLSDKTVDTDDDVTFGRYVAAMTGMLIGSLATARNITVGPKYLGQLASRLGYANLRAYPLAIWTGWIRSSIPLLASLAYSTAKVAAWDIPAGGVRGAWNFVTDRDSRNFNSFMHELNSGILEELGSNIYMRVKSVREMVQSGTHALIPSQLENDNRLLGTWLTGGLIIERDLTTWEKWAQTPVALFETFILSLQKTLAPQLGDTGLNAATQMLVNKAIGMHEFELRRIYTEWRNRHYRAFDFANPNSDANVLSHQEMFPRGPRRLRVSSSARDMANLREMYESAGVGFDEAAARFMGELDRGNVKATFLSPDERTALINTAIDYSNRASQTNNPLVLRKRNFITNMIKPFMPWKARMLSNFGNTLGVATKIGKTVTSPEQLFRARAMQWAALATMMLLPLLFWSAAINAGDEEMARRLKKAVYNQITGFRQPWEREGGKSQAIGWAIHAFNGIPFLDMAVNTMINDLPNRASFDPSLAAIEKAKDVARYIGGVMQTGDMTYRLPELVGGLLPDTKAVINRIESQAGKRELGNIVSLTRRHAPVELVRPTGAGSSAGVIANELTPFADRMANAAMQGDMIEFRQIYDEAVEMARKMGRPNPEDSVRDMFRGRNPFSRALKSKMSEAQHAEFLAKLSDQDRASVETAEQRLSQAAESIGTTVSFAKAPQSLRPRVSRYAGGTESQMAGSYSSSTRGPRLSRYSGGATVRRLPKARLRRTVGRGTRLARIGVRRVRGPRLSRFA